MRYFIPDVQAADELGPQLQAVDKFGGVPWGLPPELWPRCEACGGSQSLLAQLLHQSDRLNLGRAGRVLFVFQCNHDPGMCSTWQAGSGANACFVLEPGQLANGLTVTPHDSPLAENEVRVVNWLERDDGISEALKEAFFDEARYFALPREVRNAVTSSTRLGGAPHSIQSPSEAPAHSEGWRFIGQLDSVHSFLRVPRIDRAWISPDADRWEGRTHVAEGPNFGDGGIAYLFLRSTAQLPEGRFMWQCG